jgi:hypothetical protein
MFKGFVSGARGVSWVWFFLKRMMLAVALVVVPTNDRQQVTNIAAAYGTLQPIRLFATYCR